MTTPSPTSSPASDSNPNSTATQPQPTHPPSHITVVALTASTSAVARKTQPVLWTNDETHLLIESYKEKWYSIGRGPLKSNHWEEIAVAVSARSGVDRSSTQCRHKIEKMRKRFRSERQSMSPISIWPFYSQMEELDSNPAPISAQPLTRLPPNQHYEEEDEEDEEEERRSKSRSINNIVRRPNRGGGLLSWGERKSSSKRRRRKKGARAVAVEMKVFAERVAAMEKKKMEFAKEIVRLRKEMENQRIHLIQTCNSHLLHFLNTAFHSF